jgi:hypothetical protein
LEESFNNEDELNEEDVEEVDDDDDGFGFI